MPSVADERHRIERDLGAGWSLPAPDKADEFMEQVAMEGYRAAVHLDRAYPEKRGRRKPCPLCPAVGGHGE